MTASTFPDPFLIMSSMEKLVVKGMQDSLFS